MLILMFLAVAPRMPCWDGTACTQEKVPKGTFSAYTAVAPRVQHSKVCNLMLFRCFFDAF